jgi:hypothetical protein
MRNAPFQLVTVPAKAVPRPVPPADDTMLQRLRNERAGLAAELSNLQNASAILRQADDTEAAAIAAIAEATRAEVGATTEWALGGCRGPQPVSDQDQRLRLALNLSDARAASLAAQASVADIDHQQQQVSEQLHAIDRQLDQVVLDALQVEHAAIIDEYRVAAEHARGLAARIHGLCGWLGEEGRRLTAANNPAGTQYLTRASALTEIKLADPGVTRLEIMTEADVWGRRAIKLRSGAK